MSTETKTDSGIFCWHELYSRDIPAARSFLINLETENRDPLYTRKAKELLEALPETSGE